MSRQVNSIVSFRVKLLGLFQTALNPAFGTLEDSPLGLFIFYVMRRFGH